MFTKDQINAATAGARTGADYPKLVRNFRKLGIRSYEHIVSDGSNLYFGDNGHSVPIAHDQELIPVADSSSLFAREAEAHDFHSPAGADVLSGFLRSGREAGIAKWVSDLELMTVTYVDKAGRAVVVEPIPTSPYS
jgi:uncharacterized protein YbcV (DUF1398 family)